jgi:hypothetical protein
VPQDEPVGAAASLGHGPQELAEDFFLRGKVAGHLGGFVPLGVEDGLLQQRIVEAH